MTKHLFRTAQTSLILTVGILFILASCKPASDRGSLIQRKSSWSIRNISSTPDEFSALRQTINFTTDTTLSSFIEYWETGKDRLVYHSDTSQQRTNHRIKLCPLKPETKYAYRIVSFNQKQYSESEIQEFTSHYIPAWLDDYYTPKKNTINIDGKLFIYKRKSPGVLVLLNSTGEIEWYNVFNDFVKTACYTPNRTFLAVLSDPGYKTAYGNHIIEINRNGDTLAHFKTGPEPFDKIFHHDVLLDKKGNIVTLTVKNIATDLSSVGGNKNDSVMCDGIQIFTKEGKKIWDWSVLEVENPLNDKNILKEKADWLHANSLSYDIDDNFLISFYNSSQIWKIDAKTGKRIWKFGENGDFPLAEEARFNSQHSVHIDKNGGLMMFDNGVKTKKSRALSFSIDEQHKTAKLLINAPLPDSLYSEKMGSAYLLDDRTILQCSTNKDVLAATDLQGKILWSIKVGGLTYRAQFIPKDQIKK